MWKTNPFYHMYLQTYLTWRNSLNAFVNDSDLGKKDADRTRFVLSLFTEAVAPTNTLLGNPAAMKKMYETGGASLVRGLTHMIEDLANNGGLPSQVNMKAFQIVNDRYPADAEQWLAKTQKKQGSWWDDWRDWLGQRAGEQKPAPQELGNEYYHPESPAPGTYVFEP